MSKVESGKYEGRHLIPKSKSRVFMRWSENFKTEWQDVTDEVIGYFVADSAHRVAAGAGAAAAGALLLGPLGLVGGLLAAKKKRLAVITWQGGKQSVLEIKDKKLHSALLLAATKNGANLD